MFKHLVNILNRWKYRRLIEGQLGDLVEINKGSHNMPNIHRQVKLQNFPSTAESLKKSNLLNQWWYYSVELIKGVVTKGAYSIDFPMLPRLMLRRCNLKNADCLDIGTMEGIIPILMRRGGAKKVMAIDAIDHCETKMAALMHYHNAEFDFKTVGLMYDLKSKLVGESYDLINCSGLLYHVISPIDVLLGVRPLLKKNGLIIISTNVTTADNFTMRFNNSGMLQIEDNTFWYVSINLLDYVLRFLKLSPIDALYLPHTSIPSSKVQLITEEETGYLSVVCRATENPNPDIEDKWMSNAAKNSWEYIGLSDWDLANKQPRSNIEYKNPLNKEFWNKNTNSLNLSQFIRESTLAKASSTAILKDTHHLALDDLD